MGIPQSENHSGEFSRRILVLFAHPSQEHSEVNRPMVDVLANVEGVTVVDLYAEYADFQIDIDREQQRLVEHDVIVFQHPLYWYSTPAILKEWQDLVLEHGFAYGSKETALNGKIFFSSLTAGGLEAAYQAEGYNHFTIRELLRPLEQMASLCHMYYLPPFTIFGSRTAVEEDRVGEHVEDWLRLLRALRDDRIDLAVAQDLPSLNAGLDDIILGG